MEPGLVSIVVPVYRSARALEELHARVRDVFAARQQPFELILVEDAGGDASWEVMQALRRRDGRVRIVRLAHNHGQHVALMCGFQRARGEWVVTLDDDLQNPPEEIPRLLAALADDGADVAYGVPRREPRSWLRRVLSRCYTRLVAATFGLRTIPRITSFRALRRPIVASMLAIPTPEPILGPLALRVTRSLTERPVDHARRPHGRGHYTWRKLARHFLHGALIHGLIHRVRRPRTLGFGALGLAAVGLALLGATLAALRGAPTETQRFGGIGELGNHWGTGALGAVTALAGILALAGAALLASAFRAARREREGCAAWWRRVAIEVEEG